MEPSLQIDARFHGPPNSGHGGYTCGLVAEFLGGAVEVTLRSPPPLDTPLAVTEKDRRILVRHGEKLVAEAEAAHLDPEVPDPVSLEAAKAASRDFIGFRNHAFPTCFACGPERKPGDGLRIFAGPVPGRNLVAAPWTPDASLATPQGFVAPAFVWAALDCPGYAAACPGAPAVLGRMAAEVLGPVRPEEAHLVVAWPLGSEGRKAFAGTALFRPDGRLLGHARQTWIRLEA